MDCSSRTVFLEKCPRYDRALLADCMGRVTGPLFAAQNVRSARVLLKPNLVSATHGTLPCTDGDFILAAARLFLDHGAHVQIGDSPAFGSAASVLARIGIGDSLKKLSVPVTNFTRVRQVTLPSGIRAGLAADALDCDILVNLPKVKAHAQLRMTLAVKNYFGCLTGLRKPLCHMIHGGRQGDFSRYIVGLLSMLPDSITIVDGITAMHETGPVRGQAFELGLIAGSFNPVAIDRAFLDIVGLKPSDSPLMGACIRAGMTATDSGELEFPLQAPGQVRVKGFEVPGELDPIRFNPFRFVKNRVRRLGRP